MLAPTAIVTGASRGIGRAIALKLAVSGFDIVVNYVANERAAKETAELIRKTGRRAITVQADVSVADERAKLLAATISAFDRLDVLVNNAGIASPGRKDLLEATEESFDQVLATNLKGPFFLSQAAAKQMLQQSTLPERPRGILINISSISAFTASTSRSDYCLAKAAMGMMTWLFADRLAQDGILAYELCPGVVETDMTQVVHEKYDNLIGHGLTPIRRWGQPEDVAKAAAMLASGILSFSTGERIHVDGGYHIRRL